MGITTTSVTIKFKGKDESVSRVITKVNRGLKTITRTTDGVRQSQTKVTKSGMDFARTLTSVEKGLNRITNLGMNAANSFRLMSQGLMSVGKSMTMFLTPIIFIFFKKAYEAAVSFDAQLVRVQKTTGFAADAMAILARGIRDMAMVTSTGATELASIAEQLGQVGIKSVPEILKLTEIMNMLIMSTDVTADKVGMSMGRLANAFGIDLNTEDGVEELRRLINVINKLENDMATNVPEIIKGLENFAQAGAILDFPPQLGAAFVATLSSLGFSADESGTAMRNLTLKTTQNLDAVAALMGATEKYNTVAKLTAALNEDFAGTLVDIIRAAGESEDKVSSLAAMFDAVGIRGGKALSSLAANSDQLLVAIGKAQDEYVTATSLQIEYERALLSTENQMKMLKNQFNEFALVIGDTFLPIINTLIATAIPAVRRMIDAFAGLPDPMKKVIIAGLLLLAVLGPIILFASQIGFGVAMMMMSFFRLIQVITGLGFVLARVALGFGSVLVGITGLSAGTVLAVLLIGTAIAALVIKVFGLGDKISKFFLNLGEKAEAWGANLIGEFATGMLKAAATIISKVLTAIGNFIGRFLAGSSPPDVGPLSHIDKWGKNVFDAFLSGFNKANFGILKDVGRRIEKLFSTLAKVKIIGEKDQFKFAMQARQDLAELIKVFKKTGKISEKILKNITANMGEAGDEIQKLIKLWLKYTDIQKQLADLEKERHATLDTYRQEIQLIAQSTMGAEAKADAIRQAMRLRDEGLKTIAEEEHALEDEMDIAKEQLEIQKALIDAMQKQDDIQLKLLDTIDKLVGKMDDLGDFEFPEIEPFGIPDPDPDGKIDQLGEDFRTMGERVEAGKLAMEGFFAGLRGENFDDTIFADLKAFDEEAGTDFANTYQSLWEAGNGIHGIWEKISTAWENASGFFEQLGEVDMDGLTESIDSIAGSLETIALLVAPLAALITTLKLMTAIRGAGSLLALILSKSAVLAGIATALGNIGTAVGLIKGGAGLGTVIEALTGISLAAVGAALVVPLLVAAIVAGVVWILFNLDKVKAGWEGLKTALEAQVALRKHIFAEFKENALEAWDKIKEGWEGVKTAIAAQVALRKEIWSQIKEKALKAWEDITKGWEEAKTELGEQWEELKTIIGEKLETIKQVVSEKWEAIKTAISEKWEAIKTAVIEKIEAIKTAITEKWDEIKTGISEKMEEIKTAISEKWEDVKTAISKVFDTIWENIQNSALFQFFDAAWESIKENAIMVWETFIEEFGPIWDRIVKLVEKVIDKVKKAVKKKWEQVKKVVGKKIEEIREFIRAKWDRIVEVVTIAIDKAKTIIKQKWEEIKEVIGEKIEEIKEFIGEKWEAIKEIIGEKIDAIREFISEKWDEIKTRIGEKWDEITTFIGEKWEEIKTLIGEKLDIIKEFIGEKWEEIKEFIGEKWEAIKEIIGEKIEAIKEFISEKWELIKTRIGEKIEEIKTFIGEKWELIKTLIGEKLDAIKKFIGEKWDAVKTFIGEKWDEITTFIGEKVQEVVDKIAEYRQAFIDAGVALIQGVIDGMGSMISSLIKKAGELARAALDAIEDFFEEKSPSKVMMEVGVNVVKGLMIGMGSMEQSLADSVSGTLMSGFSELQGGLGGLAGAAPAFETGGGAAPQGNITLKFGKDSVRSDEDIEEIADSVERVLSQRAEGNMDVAAGFGEDF